MKLLTFEVKGQEKWGVIISSKGKDEQEQLILVPQMFEDLIPRISPGTSSHFYGHNKHYIKDGKWPDTITDLLSLEDGIECLKRLQSFAEYFLFNEDLPVRKYCTYKEADVKIKAPIPRPRIYYGLVQNSTAFLRNDPTRKHVNVYPQGHQRPITTVVGAGEYLTVERNAPTYGFNVEMAIIIGKKGRNIKARDAMDYVAGYTNVLDLQANGLGEEFRYIDFSETGGAKDWFCGATASWMAKKEDTNCPMGPYLITKDEIHNPYELLAYTRENGAVRDKAHTSNTLIGIERFIEHYTSYATIYPGDVLHLGTIGVDGKWKDAYWDEPETVVMEGEIENFGNLVVPIKFIENVWSSDNPTVEGTMPHSPVIQEMIKTKNDVIEKFDINNVNSFWCMYGNYKKCLEIENLLPLEKVSRVINNPASALTIKTDIALSPRSTDIYVSAEICFVVKKVARNVSLERAAEYILGYSPMVSFNDQSFHQDVLEPASPQERNLPDVYAKWADETNILKLPVALNSMPISKVYLSIDGVASIELSTDEYIFDAAKQIEFMTRHLTLMPGDVISLGRMSKRILVSAEIAAKGITGKLSIEKIGDIMFKAKKMNCEDY